MKTVAGIFASREDAARAIQRLRGIGVRDDAINVLAPGMSDRQVVASVPTDEGEQPGMGTALGVVAGGATGASIGIPIGAAISTFVLPGIGPIIAAGLLGGALFAAGGAAIGHKLEDRLSTGVPRDELFVYEEALRYGRSVVIVEAENDNDADIIRTALEAVGAESIDAAREHGGWGSVTRKRARTRRAAATSRSTRRSIAGASRPRSCRSCAAAATTSSWSSCVRSIRRSARPTRSAAASTAATSGTPRAAAPRTAPPDQRGA